MAVLREALSRLINDETSAAMLAEDVGIRRDLIPRAPLLADYWGGILAIARRDRRMTALMRRVLERYGDDPELRPLAAQAIEDESLAREVDRLADAEVAVPALEKWGIPPGRFRVCRTLGEGGFGVVLEVEDVAAGTKHALKLFLPQRSTGETDTARTRFLRGGRLMRDVLEHPHIVRVEEIFGEGTARPALLMRFVEGVDLDALVRRPETSAQRLGLSRPPSRRELVELVRQVVTAVAYAHGHDVPIVHRDIKPNNILVSVDGGELVARLADFDLAHRPNRDLTGFFDSTDARLRAATAYMAPEFRARFDNYADSDQAMRLRSMALDYYSLCACLCFVVTRREPPDTALLQSELDKEGQALREELGGGGAKALVEIIVKGMPALLAHTPRDVRDLEASLRGIVEPRRGSRIGSVLEVVAGAPLRDQRSLELRYGSDVPPPLRALDRAVLMMAVVASVSTIFVAVRGRPGQEMTSLQLGVAVAQVSAAILFLATSWLLKRGANGRPVTRQWKTLHRLRRPLLAASLVLFAVEVGATGLAGEKGKTVIGGRSRGEGGGGSGSGGPPPPVARGGGSGDVQPPAVERGGSGDASRPKVERGGSGDALAARDDEGSPKPATGDALPPLDWTPPTPDPLPAAIDLTPDFPPPIDMGDRGASLSSAIASVWAYRLGPRRDGGGVEWTPDRLYSVSFLFNQRARGDCSRGEHFEGTLRTFAKQGIASIAEFPEEMSGCARLPDKAVLEKASRRRPAAWGSIPPDQLKRFLTARYPVIVGIPIDHAFVSYKHGVYRSLGGDRRGSTVVTIVGFDDRQGAYRVRAPRGAEWGDKGHAWVAYDWMHAHARTPVVVIRSFDDVPFEQRSATAVELIKGPFGGSGQAFFVEDGGSSFLVTADYVLGGEVHERAEARRSKGAGLKLKLGAPPRVGDMVHVHKDDGTRRTGSVVALQPGWTIVNFAAAPFVGWGGAPVVNTEGHVVGIIYKRSPEERDVCLSVDRIREAIKRERDRAPR